eukprot:4102079-Amphidinium_carterae.1
MSKEMNCDKGACSSKDKVALVDCFSGLGSRLLCFATPERKQSANRMSRRHAPRLVEVYSSSGGCWFVAAVVTASHERVVQLRVWHLSWATCHWSDVVRSKKMMTRLSSDLQVCKFDFCCNDALVCIWTMKQYWEAEAPKMMDNWMYCPRLMQPMKTPTFIFTKMRRWADA